VIEVSMLEAVEGNSIGSDRRKNMLKKRKNVER